MAVGIMGILLKNRREQAPEVQEILTDYGDVILTRSGVHDPAQDRGLITLTVEAGAAEIAELTKELESVPGVAVRTALFETD